MARLFALLSGLFVVLMLSGATANLPIHPNISSTDLPSSPTPKTMATSMPSVGHFTLSKNGTTCILLNLDCNIRVVYPLKKSTGTKTVSYHIPSNAKASGMCSSNSNMVSLVTLSWNVARANLSLTLGFKEGSTKWKMNLLKFIANGNGKPVVANGTDTDLSVGTNVSSLPVKGDKGYSYLCAKAQKITLSDRIEVTIKTIHAQPFAGEFGKANDCKMKKDNKEEGSIVPLAVGCALAGLVVILIIAYFVGRGRARGYEKM